MPEHGVGPGRVLVFAYGVFVVAAGGRSAVQLTTDASRAPTAYWLSALAASIYLAGAVSLVVGEHDRRWTRIVFALELVGVIGVGLWTIVDPAVFPEATVWSHFGSGYGYVPAVLPVLSLMWTIPSPTRRSGSLPAERRPARSW